MAATNSLDSFIHLAPIPLDVKCEILRHLWGFDVRRSNSYDSFLDYNSYFGYYTSQCSDALHDGGRHVSVRTHKDIIEIAHHLKNSVSRDSVKQILRSKLPLPSPAKESELLDGSIDLVARLLFMVEFGSLQYGFTGGRQVVWTEGTLRGCIAEYFRAPQALKQEHVKLERMFNAWNLERIAGIRIQWTNNLAEHLSLVDDDRKVAVFHHASFLECQRQSTLFPAGLIDETLRTLALLFPGTDKGCKKWFMKLSRSQNLDPKAIKCGRLRVDDRRIENFQFWHDRLVTLKQLFDEAEPETLTQWWCDRRKRVQWYTFWIAAMVLALTIFFGVVQCIEGALQVHKAYNPP
ncbi:hypothetical protein B0O99DRAFT_44298 [Bisporella sp. PMI_857]|nr:hypothetical protein B0O99DRAFT_44298 [Bisporella sp. PMI_857]